MSASWRICVRLPSASLTEGATGSLNSDVRGVQPWPGRLGQSCPWRGSLMDGHQSANVVIAPDLLCYWIGTLYW